MGKHKSEAQMRQEFIDEEIESLRGARKLAKELFGKEASDEEVLGCYERMIDGDDVDDLTVAREIARGGFEIITPTPEMVFGIHDCLFDADGDEEA